MEPKPDAIVVGGGIIGLACAHYLLKNKLSVRMIEKDLVGSGASHGNCGLLHFSGVLPLCGPGVVGHEIFRALRGTSPLYIKPELNVNRLIWLFQFAAHCNWAHFYAGAGARQEILDYSEALYRELFSDGALPCDLEKKGLLLLFKNKTAFEHYRAANRLLKTYGREGRPLNPQEARELEPAIADDVVGAYHNEHDYHLRPEMLTQAWKKQLVRNGLVIEEKCRVLDIEADNGMIRSVQTVKGRYRADVFVWSTGAWSAELRKKLRLNIPVQPGKGYSITMEKPRHACGTPCLLYERSMVVTPWRSGYRLGGTMELSGFDGLLNPERLSRLISGAREYLTTSVDNPIMEQWTGFRPMTWDDLPIIGRSNHHKNLYMATGHGMLGLTLATGTGKAICDLILENRSDIRLSPFSPHRFKGMKIRT